MSKTSSLGTFPSLRNFKVVRVHGYRRVFRHPAGIFFERGIADMNSLRISSLSTEECEGNSFLAVSFQIDCENCDDFLRREEEFNFDVVSYEDIETGEIGSGLMCVNSTDDVYVKRWGEQQYFSKYLSHGLHSIWNWQPDSGILPCSVYLRHCYLSAKSLGEHVLGSFLDDTYLADRQTTIRSYLSRYPEILDMQPPESLIGRYSG